MIEDAANYLREGDDALKTVLIGGVCLLFSFLIVPAFIVLGYILRVIDRTAAGIEEPPTFDDGGGLVVDGAKAFVVLFIYGLVPLAVVFLTVGIGVLGAFGGDVATALGGLLIAVGLFAAFVLNLAVAYIVPAALANYTETRRIGAGFEIETLRFVLFDRRYAIGWLTAFVMILVGGVVASVLSVVPLLGTFAGALVIFYTVVAAYYIIGHTWADVKSGEETERGVVGRGTEA